MKVCIVAAIAGGQILSSAETFRLEGKTFHPPTNCEIAWAARTNDLPGGLWIYKVIPEAFSAAVLSNAMRIGNFQIKDLNKANSALSQDRKSIYFQSKNEFNRSRFLSIAPSLGMMEFRSQVDANAPTLEVPSAEETERLGRYILFQLGIDRSLLASRVRNGYDNTRTRYDRNGNQTSPPEVTIRGVSFERCVDGISLSDNWCFLIHFGNHGAVIDFSLVWRNILPYESHQLATPSQIVELIKSGNAVFPEQPFALAELSPPKKLTVVRMKPRYYNGHKGEPLDFMYPYAELDISADIGKTNSVTFHLTCQIIKRETKSSQL